MRLWLPVAGLLVSNVAEATIVVPMTIEQMTAEATCVARGRVMSTQSAWDDAQRRIYTYTEIQILERIHAPGQVPELVMVRTLGGEVGEVGMKVSGTPRFTLGEEVIVFLRSDPVDPEQYQVIGMSQGKLHVDRPQKGGEFAMPSLEGLAFAKAGSDGQMKIDPSHEDPARIALDDLRARVRAAVTPRAPAAPAVDLRPDDPATPRTTAR